MNKPNATPLQSVPKFSETNLVKLEYDGIEVRFSEDGWFNATNSASRFGKRVNDFISLPSTKEYLSVLEEIDNPNTNKSGITDQDGESLNTRKVGDYSPEKSRFVKAKRGQNGGTWFHPALAVAFARWLDVRFAIWCDKQIRELLEGTHPHYDWKRVRHEATSSFKVMNAVLQLIRQNQEKKTQHFHYANEAKLVNWALTGEFKKLDRDLLASEELDMLAKLEERNAVMLGVGLDREERKLALSKFVCECSAPAMIQEGGAL